MNIIVTIGVTLFVAFFISNSAPAKRIWIYFVAKHLIKLMEKDPNNVDSISQWFADYKHNGGNGRVEVLYWKWAAQHPDEVMQKN